MFILDKSFIFISSFFISFAIFNNSSFGLSAVIEAVISGIDSFISLTIGSFISLGKSLFTIDTISFTSEIMSLTS